MIRKPALVLMLVSALLAAARPGVVHAHAQSVRIAVGRNGFGNSVLYTVNVEEGHPVTITFTYADLDMPGDNTHEIKIKGAGLELPAVRVSKEEPVATITFTPTRTGTLHILCVIPCVGMENLVGGLIKVEKPRATGEPMHMSLDLKPRDDGSVLARAILTDKTGAPQAGREVTFLLHSSVGGELLLGAPTTIENGSAVMKIPASAGKALSITAEFAGGDGLAYASDSKIIEMSGQPPALYLRGVSSPTAPPVLALLFLVILGGVWTAYAYVALHVLRLRRD